MDDIETRSEMASRFECKKCQTKEGKAIEVSFTSDDPALKFLNIQHNECIAVSCKKCGFTEFYDRETISGPNPKAYR